MHTTVNIYENSGKIFVENTDLSRINDMIQVNAIIYNRQNGKKISSLVFSNINKYIELIPPEDGWITIINMFLPKKDSICDIRKKRIVYTNENHIYIYLNGEYVCISDEDDLLDLFFNSDKLLDDVECKDFVYINNIKNMYLDYAKNILSNNKLNKEFDLISNYLDVINYSIKKESYEEALRLLELFSNCSRLQKYNNKRSRNIDCGCSR